MSADLLTRLIAAGTPADLIAEVAMLSARAEAAGRADPVAERRREWDRQYRRERRQVEKAAASGGSGGCRVDNADNADAAPALDKESFPQTPFKEINPTPGVIPATREEPVSAEHPLNAIVAAWLAVFTVTAEHRRKRWRGMPPPPGVMDDQWRGYLDHRKSLRKSLTDRAYQLLCGKLAKLSSDEWPPGRIVDKMTERSWLSFELEWLTKATDNRNGQRPHHQNSNGHSNPMVTAVADAQADRVARGDVDLGNGWGSPGH